MGRDLVQHQVRADDSACQLAAAPVTAAPEIFKGAGRRPAASSTAASRFLTAPMGLPAVRV